MLDELEDAVTGRGVVTAFQQVVALSSGEIVGYEALSRWPATAALTPLDVISHAGRTGRLDELDRACARAAAKAATAGGATPDMLLLVNSEPTTTWKDLCHDLDVLRAAESFNLVFEITERGLLDDPCVLLRKVAMLRSLGIAVALDDVGAHPDSVAMLDVVAPDMLKLDMGLVQKQPDRLQARTIAAVRDYQQRTGAVVCAEGIETEAHLEHALAYGATLGQGYLFGAPGQLRADSRRFVWPDRQRGSRTDRGPSVFDIAAAGQAVQMLPASAVQRLTRRIQSSALRTAVAPIILTSTGGRGVEASVASRYRRIATKSPLVAVFGPHPTEGVGGRVRMVGLDADDPVAEEFSIVVLGPGSAVCLVARERAAQGAQQPYLDVVCTVDRERVAEVARALLRRLCR
ncbi:EAL domain-containing protein [Mycobacterium sp. SMC-4]|uniref:EAL domain-containing protein n=1 Tax=Mycobacterium sp. SMC-4 TaxID=2857059 RepID=UPI003D04EAC2